MTKKSNVDILQQLRYFPLYLEQKAYQPLFDHLMDALSRYSVNKGEAFKKHGLNCPITDHQHFQMQVNKVVPYLHQVQPEIDFIVQVLFSLLSQKDFVLNEEQISRLMHVHWIFSSMLSSSSFHQVDDLYLIFQQQLTLANQQGAPEKVQRSLLAKMLFAYGMASKQSIDLEKAWQIHRTLTVHFIFSLCSTQLTYCTLSQQKMQQCYGFIIEKMQNGQVDLGDIPGHVLTSFYLNCAYYYPNNHYEGRRLINQIIQRKVNSLFPSQLTRSPFVSLTKQLIAEGNTLDFHHFILLMFHDHFYWQFKNHLETFLISHSSLSDPNLLTDEFLKQSQQKVRFDFVANLNMLNNSSVFFKTHARFFANVKPIFQHLFYRYIQQIMQWHLQCDDGEKNTLAFWQFIKAKPLDWHDELVMIKQLHLDSDISSFNQWAGLVFEESAVEKLNMRLSLSSHLLEMKTIGIVSDEYCLPVKNREYDHQVVIDREKLFDEIIINHEPVLFDKLRKILDFCQSLKNEKPHGLILHYHLSVGLTAENWIFANAQLGDIQVMGTGHACTASDSQVDYFWAENGYTSDNTQSVLTEQLIRLPDAYMPITLPLGFQMDFLSKKKAALSTLETASFDVLAEDLYKKMSDFLLNSEMNLPSKTENGVVNIGVVGFLTKFNPKFLTFLQSIQQHIVKHGIQVNFIFVVNQLNDITYGDFYRNMAAYFSENSFFIYPGLKYADYLENLKIIDFAISPFPFGNDNSAVDLLYHGILSLSHRRDDMPSLTDTSRTKMLSIPTELVSSTSLDELREKALFLAMNKDVLDKLKISFIKEMRLLRLMM